MGCRSQSLFAGRASAPCALGTDGHDSREGGMSVEVCRLRALAACACGLRRPPSSAIAATPLEKIPARPSVQPSEAQRD